MTLLRYTLLALMAFLCFSCDSDKDDKGADTRILTVEDLSRLRMATVISTVGEDYICRHFPGKELQAYDDILGPIEALKAKRVDAVITVRPNAVYALNNNPGLTLMPNVLARRGLSFVMAKGNVALRDSINKVILGMKADGTTDSLTSLWMKHGNMPKETIETDDVQSDRVLRVGMSATYPPFAFIGADGEITGYEAEMARIIAKRMGMRVKLSNIKFAGMISALQAGTVDVVASMQSPTDKLKPAVEFSEPYYDCELVAIVRSPKHEGRQIEPGEGSWWRTPQRIVYNNLIEEKRYNLIAEGLCTTVLISLLAAVLGTLLGFVVCFARLAENRFVRKTADAYVVILQGIPDVVWLMLCFYVIFVPMHLNAITVSIISFGFKFSVVVAEMLGSSITNIGNGQIEAGLALGFSRSGVFRHIIMPQAVRRALPSYLTSFSELFKMTAIVGIIAITDLAAAGDIIRSCTFDAFFPLMVVSVVYFLLGWLISLSFNRIIAYIDRKRRK